MPFASSVFSGAPRAGTRTVHDAPEVLRVDQGSEDGAHLVEVRFGPRTDASQVALVRDGHRLLLVSRPDGALLREIAFPGPVVWDRMEVRYTGGLLTVRAPEAHRSPVPVRPCLRAPRRHFLLRSLRERVAAWLDRLGRDRTGS
ncbi:Hsp20/alpha crystallin family protein [Nocardiopsis flavescens]|uniref:Hsp20/alpha crystallin family protein n=1 Tax=Nocardiopsis flavescens TaxID=758803 RepID=UPI003650298D